MTSVECARDAIGVSRVSASERCAQHPHLVDRGYPQHLISSRECQVRFVAPRFPTQLSACGCAMAADGEPPAVAGDATDPPRCTHVIVKRGKTKTCRQYAKPGTSPPVCGNHLATSGASADRVPCDHCGTHVLRREMELAIEATEREARDEVRVAQTELENVSTQLSVAQGELTAARQNAAATASGAKESVERTNARALEAEAEAHRLREHASQLEEEGGNLTAQIEAFAVVNARLQDAATSAQTRADAECAKVSNLRRQIETLEKAVQAGRSERTSGESELKRKLQGALEELASVIATRDEQKLLLQETLAKCASAMARSERMEVNERTLKQSVENLNRSKALLQETMVEQLASVRSQLERAQTQNRDLESMMRRQAANTEKLQGLVEASTPGLS